MPLERHNRNDLFMDLFIEPSEHEKFFNREIMITGDDTLNSTNGVLMAKTLVNLVARFSNKLYISLPKKYSKLEHELILIAKSIGINSESKISKLADIVISIGNTTIKGDFIIRINSNGWVSHLSCNKPLNLPKTDANPIGANGSCMFWCYTMF